MQINTARLSPREVYQVLKEIALGLRTLHRASENASLGVTVTDSQGWTLTLIINGDMLNYCEACVAPDGRTGTVDTWQRQGTDPINLLSHWEHTQLVRMLKTV